MPTVEPLDGRRARRERTRTAVIDAVFSLVQEGVIPPTVDDVAARSGVSASSIFRNFDGLADVQHQALQTFGARFEEFFLVADTEGRRDQRIQSHVRSRVELLGTASGLIRIARARALDHEPIRTGTEHLQAQFADQTRQRFAVELKQLTSVEAANLCAVIDATTSPAAFDLMLEAHGRTARQISKTWVTALAALLAQWVPQLQPAKPLEQKP